MATNKLKVSIHLDPEARQRIDKAATISKQSTREFLEAAGLEQSRRVLLAWAVERHQNGEASFSELADETGLAIEEIMRAAEHLNSDATLNQFLAGAESLAGMTNDSELLQVSRDAVELVRKNNPERSGD